MDELYEEIEVLSAKLQKCEDEHGPKATTEGKKEPSEGKEEL